jgi:Ca-activated chloride channel family protein
MFRFAHPTYLYLLILVPVFIIIYWLYQKKMKRNLRKFGDPELLKHLMPEVSLLRRNLKFILMMIALALAVFMIARPQYGTRNEEVKRSGIEVVIAVDVSNSMLCRDIQPSRLEKAKMIVSKLVDQFDSDRIGLVMFAGKALTLLPVTSDYVSAKMFLDQMDPSAVSLQGTSLAEAIKQANRGFTTTKNVGRALILITDAEDHEDGAIEAAKESKKAGIRIFVLSVGTEAGGPIPMGGGNYKTDNNGQTVITRLNENVGKGIAQAGNGVYINVDQTERAQMLLSKELDDMQKADISAKMFSEYDEQFVAVAILLFVVLLADLCIAEKKNPLLRFNVFSKHMGKDTVAKG